MTDESTVLLRYSLYQTKLTIPNTSKRPYNDCWYDIGYGTSYPNCVNNGEASIALKQAAGRAHDFARRFHAQLQHAGQQSESAERLLRRVEAGLRRPGRRLHSSSARPAEARYYREITDDFVGMLKVQGGSMFGNDLLITDQFFLGPSLVRGFAPSGIGPRDATDPRNNALGGTTYFGGTAEVQFPIFGLPRELGMRGAVFADAGTLFGYKGGTNFSSIAPYSYCPGGSSSYVDEAADLPFRHRQPRHPHFGRREPSLAVAAWSDPLRLRLSADQEQVRPDAVLPLLRRHFVLVASGPAPPSRGAGPSPMSRHDRTRLLPPGCSAYSGGDRGYNEVLAA